MHFTPLYDSHTTISKHNSTKLCEMLGSELYLQMHVNNLRALPPQNWAAKNCLFCDSSWQHYVWCRKLGRDFYPPSVNVYHDYSASRIRWCRIANVNGTIEIKSLVSLDPKTFQYATASRQAALSGNINTSLIATSSSFLYNALDKTKNKYLNCWTINKTVITVLTKQYYFLLFHEITSIMTHSSMSWQAQFQLPYDTTV